MGNCGSCHKHNNNGIEYEDVGSLLCQPKGGPGIRRNAFQRYDCNEDEDLNGALCYPKCPAGYRASTANICEMGEKQHCEQNHGEGNCEHWGALAYPKCKKEANLPVGRKWDFIGYAVPNDRLRYFNTLMELFFENEDGNVELTEEDAKAYMPLVSPARHTYIQTVLTKKIYVPSQTYDYHPNGCCICGPSGGPRIVRNAFDRYLCRPDEELHGALCYPKCRDGFTPFGCCMCDHSKDLKWLQKRGGIDKCLNPDFPTHRNGMCHYKPPDSAEAPYNRVAELRGRIHNALEARFPQPTPTDAERDQMTTSG